MIYLIEKDDEWVRKIFKNSHYKCGNIAEGLCAKARFIPHSTKPNNYRESQAAASYNLKNNEIAKSFAGRWTDAHKNVWKLFIPAWGQIRERTFKYLEIKARSILFNEEVEGILRDCGIKYKKNYIRNGLVCDFLLEDGQIGLECKFNAMRDIERTFTTLKILLDNLELKKIALIVPLKSEISESIIKDLERLNISVLSLYELGKFFKR